LEGVWSCSCLFLPFNGAVALLRPNTVCVIHSRQELSPSEIVTVNSASLPCEILQAVGWGPVRSRAGYLLRQDIPLEGGGGRPQGVRHRHRVRRRRAKFNVHVVVGVGATDGWKSLSSFAFGGQIIRTFSFGGGHEARHRLEVKAELANIRGYFGNCKSTRSS